MSKDTPKYKLDCNLNSGICRMEGNRVSYILDGKEVDIHTYAFGLTTLHQKQSGQIEAALDTILQYGGIDGDHHKMWTLDQVVRNLTKEKYGEWVRDHNAGEDGPDTYLWDEGIAP